MAAFDLEIPLESGRDLIAESSRCVVLGKIISDRVVNRTGVFGVLRSMWTAKELKDVRELSPNLFTLSFHNLGQVEKAIEEGPWTVMGCCFLLKHWGLDMAVKDVDFTRCHFWIQIHNLPLEMLTGVNARKIGDRLGRVLAIDEDTWEMGLGRSFLRIKVELDITVPLMPGFWVPRGSQHRIWAAIRYERMADFCYNCGILGHQGRSCKREKMDRAEVDMQRSFGPWMKAMPVQVKDRLNGLLPMDRLPVDTEILLKSSKEGFDLEKFQDGVAAMDDKNGTLDVSEMEHDPLVEDESEVSCVAISLAPDGRLEGKGKRGVGRGRGRGKKGNLNDCASSGLDEMSTGGLGNCPATVPNGQ